MGLDKKHYQIIVATIIGLSTSMACDKNTAEENPIHGADTAQQALALFCESEFADEATRYNYVGLSSERKRLEELRNNEPLQLNTDPLFIVSTYHVSGVHFDDTTGKGKVVFERLAYTRGLGNDVNYNPNPPREIIPEYKESEEVDYDLKKIRVFSKVSGSFLPDFISLPVYKSAL